MSGPEDRLPLFSRIDRALYGSAAARPWAKRLHALHKRARAGIESAKRTLIPAHLGNFERKVFSQNGEDGVIEEIFRRIGAGGKFFVEFGIQDGTECNTRRLLEQEGWKGAWIEGSPDSVLEARARFGELPIVVLNRFITRENILELFQEAGVLESPDLLSIDIDGNDYWMWKEIALRHQPRVVVIEYNAGFLPGIRWRQPYAADYRWDLSSRFGASLSSLEELGQELGYELVACESTGVNAFFVRQDLVEGRFIGLHKGAPFHYVAPKYNGEWYGHPPIAPERGPVSQSKER